MFELGQGVRKMNIQQYYEQSATASLNASLVAVIPPSFLLIYSVVITEIYQLMFLGIPFIIYSFYCYQVFLLNRRRSQTVNIAAFEDPPASNDLFDESTLLIAFLPAPTLRLLLFTPNGIKAGEIRDKSFFPIRWFLPYFIDRLFTRKLGLYDQQDQLLLYFHLHRDRIEIFSVNGELMTTVFRSQEGRKKEYMMESMGVTVEKKGIPADYLFRTHEDLLLAQIKTGYMPLEWGKRFINPNTPILNLNNNTTKSDKIQLLSMLSSIYVYSNH